MPVERYWAPAHRAYSQRGRWVHLTAKGHVPGSRGVICHELKLPGVYMRRRIYTLLV